MKKKKDIALPPCNVIWCKWNTASTTVPHGRACFRVLHSDIQYYFEIAPDRGRNGEPRFICKGFEQAKPGCHSCLHVRPGSDWSLPTIGISYFYCGHPRHTPEPGAHIPLPDDLICDGYYDGKGNTELQTDCITPVTEAEIIASGRIAFVGMEEVNDVIRSALESVADDEGEANE